MSKLDRRNILRRIEHDEKQADLAKEYQVSRAAISNMKQRCIRKERRGGAFIGQHEELAVEGEHCEQVHTEERDSAPLMRLFDSDQSYNHQADDSNYHHLNISEFTQSPLPVGSYSSKSEELQDPASPPWFPTQMCSQQQQQTTLMSMERVIQVDTSMVQILFTRLLDERTDAHTLQVATMRIARLLLEHAMSTFPTRAVEIPLAGSSSSSYYLGVEFAKPTCAITLKSEGGGGGAAGRSSLLLRDFSSNRAKYTSRLHLVCIHQEQCPGSLASKSARTQRPRACGFDGRRMLEPAVREADPDTALRWRRVERYLLCHAVQLPKYSPLTSSRCSRAFAL